MGEMFNEYLGILDKCQFDDTPKTVWASIAVSLAYRLQEEGDDTARFSVIPSRLFHEWHMLYANGIVPQKPKRSRGKKAAS